MGEWEQWSVCDAKACDTTGAMKRQRKVLHSPKRLGGGGCKEPTEMIKSCQMKCTKDARDGRSLSTTDGFMMGPERLVGVDLPSSAAHGSPISVVPAPVPSPADVSVGLPPKPKPIENGKEELTPEQTMFEPPPEEKTVATRLRSSGQASLDDAVEEPKVVERRRVAEPELGLGLPAKKKKEGAPFTPLQDTSSSGQGPSPGGAAAVDEGAQKPAVNDFRARLTAFYQEHNPSKLGSVDSMLARYQGREEVLLANLVSKYGPEPSGVQNEEQKTSAPAEKIRKPQEKPATKSAKWAW
jgi:hypothetical protein